MKFSFRSIFHIRHMRRREHATLRYSYVAEFGRGLFAAMCVEFALLVAISHFDISNKYLLWIISSAAFMGLIVAVFTTSLTVRYRKKHIIMGVEIISRLVAIVTAMATTGTWFVIVMAIGIAMNGLGVPLISGIYGANLRSAVRGHVVGRLISLMIGTTALTSALAGFLMKLSTNYFRIVLICVSVISLACSWYANYHLPEALRKRTKKSYGSLKDFLKVFKNDLAFLYLEVVWFLIGFCNLWLLPVRILRLKEIHFNDSQIMVAIVTVVGLTTVVMANFWGRIIYRINFGVFRIILSGLFLIGTLTFFHSRSFFFVCLGSFIFALALSGGQLSWRLIATFFTTPNRVPLYMAIHGFLCGIRGFVGPLLSLSIVESHGPQFVGNLSSCGFLISIFLLLPLIKILNRRRELIEGAHS